MHQDNRIRNPHLKTKYITNWETWKKLCEQNEVDPYKFVDFGIDMGGGNSKNWEYIGDIPTDICTCSNCKERRNE